MDRFQASLADIFARQGVWIQTIASLVLMVASSFLDGIT